MPAGVAAHDQEIPQRGARDDVLDDLIKANVFRLRLADDGQSVRLTLGQCLGECDARECGHRHRAVFIQDKVLSHNGWLACLANVECTIDVRSVAKSRESLCERILRHRRIAIRAA
jgi:hypothetical protein